MIFASGKNPGRKLDLYATFRGENGTWSDPINLGDPVNSARDELFPAEIIERLRPEQLAD